jgi:hypothetical protein
VKLGQVGQVLAATTSVFRQLLQHIVIVIVILILLLVLRYRIEALERRLARASARWLLVWHALLVQRLFLGEPDFQIVRTSWCRVVITAIYHTSFLGVEFLSPSR